MNDCLIAAAPDLLAACKAMLAALSLPLTSQEREAWELMTAAVDSTMPRGGAGMA